MRGSKCHYNFRNNTKLHYGSECHDGGSFSVPLESDDVVGNNRSAVVVESDVVMKQNVELHKCVKRRRIHNDVSHVTKENKESQ